MTFHSTFHTVGSGIGFDPAAWEALFETDSRAAWAEDGGGSLQHVDDEGRRRALVVEYDDDLGWSISYDLLPVRGRSPGRSLVSVGDAETMASFVLLGNGAVRPRGSFLAREVARAVVVGFLQMPLAPPDGVDWVDAGEIPWPEEV